MLRLAFTFLFTGLFSAAMGYSGAASVATDTAKLQIILFFFILFLSLIANSSRKNLRYKIVAEK